MEYSRNKGESKLLFGFRNLQKGFIEKHLEAKLWKSAEEFEQAKTLVDDFCKYVAKQLTIQGDDDD